MLRDVFYYGKKPNAHPRERPAKDLEDARRQATTEHFWIINEFCNYFPFDWDFDFDFLPDDQVWHSECINAWPSQHQKDSGTWLCPKEYTDKIIYRTDVEPVKRNADMSKWVTLDKIVPDSFDFTWHPDPTSPPYIYRWGTKFFPPEIKHVLEYRSPEATQEKFMPQPVAVEPNWKNWKILEPIKSNTFDFTWRPDPASPPYIYIFGNQHYGGEIMPTVTYTVEGATAEKFVENIKAILDVNMEHWVEILPVDKTKFDFSWIPNPKDPPYVYVFGNQWNKAEIEPTLEYHTPGATEYKYISDITAHVLPDKSKFKQLLPIDEKKFDFSWRPNPKDPPYIYVFGNQHNPPEIEPTLEYHVDNATEIKHVPYVPGSNYPKTLPDMSLWKQLIKVSNSFDFSWRPNPKDPPYIYVFGNQWYSAEKEATLEYHVSGAINRKYMQDIIALIPQDRTNWEIPEGMNTDTFDFSWHPDPGSPPYIYQFGTLADDNDGPRYITPDNNGEIVRLLRVESRGDYHVPRYYIETTLEHLINEHKDEIFWALNKNINYKDFDFSWRPNIEQARYVHVFGSPESEMTQTYFVSGRMYSQGYKDFNFVQENITLDEKYLASLFKPSDMFYIDRGNAESVERYEKLKEQFPNITKTRYLNSWIDTITRCVKRSTTELCWILNSELDYSDFDFNYYPNPWQMNLVHVFGTQWSHWGTTFMVNKETFVEYTKYIKIIEHLGNLHFVKHTKAKATNNLYDIYLIDHGNSHTETIKQLVEEKSSGKPVKVIPYTSDYLTTFNLIINDCEPLKENYIWVCSSVCDYTLFDFSYICDPFAKDNLHVFPSEGQRYGDTFLVDVNKMRMLLKDMVLLEDYQKINFNTHQCLPRLPAPIFITEQDSHRAVTDTEFDFPYAIFKTHDNKDLHVTYRDPMSLWSDSTKNIEILSTGGTVIAVPKEAKNYVQSELYDYPFISRSKKLIQSQPLDIIFLSNGEKCAEENYEHLLRITKNYKNRVIRVDGINGRANSYHAAAEASKTPWMFTVFAKLKVNNRFDWYWQPDRLQVPKHYIFNALNPVNKLVYGHQAMIAYNKKLTLANTGKGLDFTLDDEHEVVDLMSGIATFNTDPYSTWRTAFREVIKLKSDYKDISYERLQTWLTVAEGEYAQDCLQGARDGVEYYQSVNGDPDQLKLTYEWDWLEQYYNRKYK
jgi:hypothetical protein